MKFFRLDLLTLLISLFILGSCKNQSTVTLPLGNQQLNGTLLVDDNITINTTAEDSVITSGLTKTPLAYFKDNILGTTESNIATAVSLPGSSAYTLPTGSLSIDSAVLVMRYADGFYGDSLSSNYKANVYQLTEQPTSSSYYYNNKTWAHASSLIGSRSFNVRPKTIIRIRDIVTGAADTLKKVPAQLRIALSSDFIQKNLFNASTAALANNAIFQNAIKGLYVTLDKNQSGAGGAIMFNLDSSNIAVYYKATTASAVDTAVTTLSLGTHAAEIKYTRSIAVTAALNNTSSNNLVYLQGLGGLRAKISFPSLSSLFGTTDVSTVTLNRAELVLTPNPGSDIPYTPQPQIYMYRYNIAHQRTVLPDANGTSSGASDSRYFSTAIFGGGYDKTEKSYHFIITGYLQDLLRGKTVDYGTFIGPIDTTSRTNATDVLATAQTAGRTVIVGSDKTSAYRIKLNIIYTKTTL
ncbi:DUF4270 domain-containing protein [Mucilaginibacter robiniae]|uniref:DUF4270 domain-containing protein n=1 Tax=Mucilaginibacter robiniae TaxID=2728022 RepID=A0A7L5E844_9SPHI|nr:DUF4270 family protein [Mucilaginibacter robiniae]QJD96516.1 DUF4270 domain-containing protein [Mucilaginibacter robiniae]